MRSTDPGDIRTHACAGCRTQIARGQLCSDCLRRVDKQIEEQRRQTDE